MLEKRPIESVEAALAGSGPPGPEPEVAAFVAFLGQLFAGLGTSLTRFAAGCHRNKGSVSRYLTGERIAPWDFVEELLRQVAEHTGNSVTAEVQEQAHLLRREALRVRNPDKCRVDELSEQLGAAERELRLANVRERALLEALEAKEEQARQAEQRYRQLEADWATARYATGARSLELCAVPDEAEQVRDELLALKAELDALHLELGRAQALKNAAEEHCARLEARLLAAEATLNAERARARSTRPVAAEAAHDGERPKAPGARASVAALESSDMVLLREISALVGTTLDLDHTARELCEALVPRIADFASVDLLDRLISDAELLDEQPDDDTMLRRVARSFVNHRASWSHVLEVGVLLAMPRSTPPGMALQGNKPVLVPVVTADIAAEYAAALGGGSSLAQVVSGRSMLVLPLSARGTVLGVLKLLRLPDRASFDESDAATLLDLAARAALSLDNARLHRAEARVATTLQRSMIPTRPPRIPGVQIAHRYLPGDRRAQVGGDWFDAIQLPGSRVALVVGDVMGHGFHSSAAMGRYRTAVRTLAALDLPPGQLLRHLDNVTQGIGDDHLATCLYAVYDPINRTCEVASAGHVPPVLVHPDGTGELLEIPAGAPAGVGGVPFVAKKIDVVDGSMLVMCTDGLVEVRGADIGAGLAALCGNLIDPRRTPDEACDTVLERLHSDDRKDDVALLVARFDGLGSDKVATWTLAVDTAEVCRARRLVRDQLAAWQLTGLADSTELLVSELVTNAVRAARDFVQVQLIRTDRLLVEVGDDNHNLPMLEPAGLLKEYGRGLSVVSKLAERWGTARRAVGKVVWFEQPLPPAE
ncbi:SpoIIE family protein phosphatase [Kitasatospora sp. NPDC057936]|uniref:ATP-binding SpoIIE family protein phosphatase n=1 Tax=Kitasatospora sp. NPDC057936 TaxID=3346283 RepID=UPI0036DA34A1